MRTPVATHTTRRDLAKVPLVIAVVRRTAFFLFILFGTIVALEGNSMAQTNNTKTGTRLITLCGTSGGPNPRGKRAQTSNLLIVNGALYVIDAGDGLARRPASTVLFL